MNTANYSQLGTNGRQPQWPQFFFIAVLLFLFALLASCGSSRKAVTDVHSVRYDSAAVVVAKRDTALFVQSWRDTTAIVSLVIDSVFSHSDAEEMEIIHETEVSTIDEAGKAVTKKERSILRKKKNGSSSGHVSAHQSSIQKQHDEKMERGSGTLLNYSDVGTHWADSTHHHLNKQKDEAKVGFFDRLCLWLFGGVKWVFLCAVFAAIGYFVWRYLRKKSIPFKWWQK